MFLMFGTLVQSILVMKSAAAAWPESVVSESRKSYCLLLNCCTTSARTRGGVRDHLDRGAGILRGKRGQVVLAHPAGVVAQDRLAGDRAGGRAGRR